MIRGAPLSELDSLLVTLNRISADVILPFFRAERTASDMVDKGGMRGYDPVTAADRGAEEAIRAHLAKVHPEHGVIGEEHGEDRPDAEYVWVIDPIDGTRAFVAGLPLWTTLIGLRHQGETILGSIGQPYIGELFIGSADGSRLVTTRAGLGAREETKLRVRARATLDESHIATTAPETYFDPASRVAWEGLRSRARIARTGCDAYAYAMIALGTMDLVVEAGLKPWDIEAAIPVLRGAGGFVTDWAGNTLAHGGQGKGQVVFAGDRAVLDEALALLAPARLV